MTTLLRLDGSQGEGGGQILRSALALSMLTGRAIELEHIRAGRRKPGLMRQHLTCVRAAADVCSAEIDGGEIGSTALTFRPHASRAGDFRFAIGTAGSTMLVLQTVLPALLTLDAPSTLALEGGTHNPLAPSADFIAEAFLPQLAAMGARVALTVERHGFLPAGGGAVTLRVEPAPLARIELLDRGDAVAIEAEALVRNLPVSIAERELAEVRRAFADADVRPRVLPHGASPANALVLRARSSAVCEVVTELGTVGVSSETVAQRAITQLRAYLAHGAPVGEHLADQLLLPMVVAGGGAFVTGRPSAHLATNAAVVEAFGVARVSIAPDDSDPQRRFRVEVRC